MGVGNYTEQDVREAARAFTGWVDDDLSFRFDASKHDGRDKTFLGRTGPFDGVDVLDIILAQPVTVGLHRDEDLPLLRARRSVPRTAGAARRRAAGQPATRSRRSCGRSSCRGTSTVRPRMGAQIKGPVELIVSTYRRLGLTALPGIPDINSASGALGQVLLNPPTVAGWAQGRAWITPATLIGRGNFAREVMFPDQINFIDPNLDPGPQIREVNNRILRGADVAAATTEETPGSRRADGRAGDGQRRGGAGRLQHPSRQPARLAGGGAQGQADRSRARVVQPDRDRAWLGSARTTGDAVDILLLRLLSVPIDADARATLIAFLDEQLGTSDIERAQTYLEQPLRLVAHLIMSRPEYQLV